MFSEYTKTEVLPPERRGAPVEIKILTSPNKHAFLSLPDIGAQEREYFKILLPSPHLGYLKSGDYL